MIGSKHWEKGYVTVWISLLTAVLMLLIMAALQIARISGAKGKAAITADKAVRQVRGYYNSYLFEQYHILLLDMGLFGNCEAGLEEVIEENLGQNLGPGFEVKNVTIMRKDSLMEDGLKNFEQQILENTKYMATEEMVKKLNGVKNQDEPVGRETIHWMDEEIGSNRKEEKKGENEKKNTKKEAEKKSETPGQQETSKSRRDPRLDVRKYSMFQITTMLKPDSIEFSSNRLSGDRLPSDQADRMDAEDEMKVHTEFEDYDFMKQDLTRGNGWGKELEGNLAALGYIKEFFNSGLHERKEGTVLLLEMEYLLCGKESDEENYRKTAERMILLRMGANFAYILTDVSKMEELTAIATSITAAFPLSEPVVKYLLAGCWAYIESVADVYMLLRNHKIPIMKTKETWMTDLDSLGKLSQLSCQETEDEEGLEYESYLLILLGMQMKKTKYRMLDLMQENANFNMKETGRRLYLEHAITGLSVDIEMEFEGRQFAYQEYASY